MVTDSVGYLTWIILFFCLAIDCHGCYLQIQWLRKGHGQSPIPFPFTLACYVGLIYSRSKLFHLPPFFLSEGWDVVILVVYNFSAHLGALILYRLWRGELAEYLVTKRNARLRRPK